MIHTCAFLLPCSLRCHLVKEQRSFQTIEQCFEFEVEFDENIHPLDLSVYLLLMNNHKHFC